VFRGRSHGCHGCCSHDYYLKRVCVCACVCECACVDYDVWGEEDEKTIKFSLLFQIICGSERTFSRSERRAEKKRKKRRLASGLFFLQKRRERREFSKTEKPLLLTNADPSHSITIPLFTCFIIYIYYC
jgi:hypothetical protein